MKKSLIIAAGACFLALGVFTAFSDSMTEEQKQEQQKIQDLLTEKLDAFRVEKEQECSDRAMEVALVRADSIITAQTAVKKPIRKKPKYTTKGPDKTTPPPPPVTEKEAVNKGRKTTTKAAKKTVQEVEKAAAKKGVNKGRRKSNN